MGRNRHEAHGVGDPGSAHEDEARPRCPDHGPHGRGLGRGRAQAWTGAEARRWAVPRSGQGQTPVGNSEHEAAPAHGLRRVHHPEPMRWMPPPNGRHAPLLPVAAPLLLGRTTPVGSPPGDGGQRPTDPATPRLAGWSAPAPMSAAKRRADRRRRRRNPAAPLRPYSAAPGRRHRRSHCPAPCAPSPRAPPAPRCPDAATG